MLLMQSLFLILLLVHGVLVEVVIADNRTVTELNVHLAPLESVVTETIMMQSSGFIDLSVVEFTPERYTTKDTLIEVAVFSGGTIGSSSTGSVCCHKAALANAECDQLNTLAVQDDFEGVLMTVTIPPGNVTTTINPMDFDPLLFVEQRGTYSIIMANCNEDAPTVHIEGTVVWESLLTASDVEATVPFYIALTVAHGIAVAWFATLMIRNEESRVRLEYYILGTIVLGFIQTGLEALDYSLYAEHLPALSIITIFFETAKQGLSRCVLMMLSVGWGVTVASLEQNKTYFILAIGGLYMILRFALSVAQLFQGAHVEENDKDDDVSSQYKSTPIKYDAIILPWLDFYVWYYIFSGLSDTTGFLEANRQIQKLQRYQWLLRIMILYVMLNVAAFIMVMMELSSAGSVDIAILPEVNEAGYFLALLAVAVLWRPNPNARAYAYAEEISSIEGGDYDLELTEQDATPGDDDEQKDDDDSDAFSHHEMT